MTTNDGGPAFPQPITHGPDGERLFLDPFGCGGMSLRDFMAAAALTGLLACDNRGMPVIDLANEAYRFADAMLAERSKRGGGA